jgi:hypothetical protein
MGTGQEAFVAEVMALAVRNESAMMRYSRKIIEVMTPPKLVGFSLCLDYR